MRWGFGMRLVGACCADVGFGGFVVQDVRFFADESPGFANELLPTAQTNLYQKLNVLQVLVYLPSSKLGL